MGSPVLVWERVSLLAQVGLKLQVFMPQPLQYWDYGCRTTPCLCMGFALFFNGLSERRQALSLFCVELSGPGFVAVLLPVPHCAGLWVFITKPDYIWFLNGSVPHQMSYQQN